MRIILWFKRLFGAPYGDLVPAMRAGTYLELHRDDGTTGGSIVCHTREIRDRFLASVANNGDSGIIQSGSLPRFIIDQIGPAGASILTGLRAGNLYQLTDPYAKCVGTAHRLMDSKLDGISLGTFVDPSSGQIVGPAGLVKAGVASVIAPDVIFRVIHVVAGLQLMRSIDDHLAQLQRSVESLIQRHQASSYGRLSAAIGFLGDLEAQYLAIGRFTPDMATRLIVAERDLQMVLGEQKMLIGPFLERSRQLLGEKSIKVLIEGDRMLEDTREYLRDSAVLIEATRAQVRLDRMWIAHDVEHVPDYVPARIEQFNQCLENCTQIADQLGRIDQLEEHVAACAKDMRWYQKMVIPRIVNRSVKRASSPEDTTSHDRVEASYYIWADDSGRINGLAELPAELEAELEQGVQDRA